MTPTFFRPRESAASLNPCRARKRGFAPADELIGAMDLLEPHVERFCEDVRSIAFAADMTSDVPSSLSKAMRHQISKITLRHQSTV
jgi:hypothetical protein